MAKNVLVIEDDDDIREAFREVLESEGYTVQTARHGEEALEQLHSRPTAPDVILLDLRMGVMDGRRFLEELKKDDDPEIRTIPVLVATAARASSLGDLPPLAKTFRKPVDLDLLLEEVERVCKKPPYAREHRTATWH